MASSFYPSSASPPPPPPPPPPASSAASAFAASASSSNPIRSSSSPDLPARYGLTPQSFRAEVRALKRSHFILTQELHEIVDPVIRQRQAREIAVIAASLLERGVSL